MSRRAGIGRGPFVSEDPCPYIEGASCLVKARDVSRNPGSSLAVAMVAQPNVVNES